MIDILICNEMDAIPIAALYKELMSEIIVKTVGDEQLVLEVATPQLPEFERSLAFYEREGFLITGGCKLKLLLAN